MGSLLKVLLNNADIAISEIVIAYAQSFYAGHQVQVISICRYRANSNGGGNDSKRRAGRRIILSYV
jgi:hypothetical protein